MKKNKLENLIALIAITGAILLFGSFMFASSAIVPALIVLAVIASVYLLAEYILAPVPFRRITAFVLCIALVGGLTAPAYASATGIERLSPYDEGSAGTSRLNYLHNMVDLMVQTYGLYPEMSDNDLANVFFALESEDAYTAWENGNTLMVDAQGLSAEEAEILKAEPNAQVCLRFYNVVSQIVNSAPSVTAISSGSVKAPLSATSNDNNGSWSLNDHSISVTVTPKASGLSGCETYSAQSSSLTLSASEETEVSFAVTKGNNGSVEIKSSDNQTFTDDAFDFTFTGSNSLTITASSGSGQGQNGTHSLQYSIKGGDVTILFKPVNGIPYKVNDTHTVENQDVSVDGGSDGFVVAAVNSAYYPLVGAILKDENGAETRINAVNGKLNPTTSGSLTPIFGYDADADGIAPLKVNAADYWDFDSAITAAGSSGTIVVNDDYTVPAGSYTISSGVTLLVPRDASDTGGWAKLETNSPPAASVYRTLTIAEGASLTVYGNIINNATLSSASGGSAHSGEVTGTYGRITNNGTVTLESGAKWTARGYVDGIGLITVKNGASIYQPIVVQDWRGGTASTNVRESVFPLNVFYLLNIMCRTQYEYGSSLHAIIQLKISANQLDNKQAQILGSSAGCIFQMESGSSIDCKFNAVTRKMEYSVKTGSVKVAYMKMTISGQSVSSEKTVVPLNDMFEINIENGATATVTHSAKLLPGAVINVKNGGTLNVEGNLYLYRGNDYDSSYANGKYFELPNSGGLFSNTARYSSFAGVNAQLNIYGTGKATGNIYSSAVNGDNSAVVHCINGGTFTPKASNETSISEHKNTTGSATGGIKFAVPDQFAVHTTNSVTEPNYAQGGYYYTESTVAPTCEDKGYTKHQCSVCDYFYADNEKPANGHKDENFDHKCDNGCGKNDMGTHADSPSDNDHVCDYGCGEVMENCSGGNAPTCTQQSICQVCGQPYGEFAPHALTLTPAVSETCGKAGNSAYNTCSVCFKYFNEAGNTEIKKDSWIIPATENHNYAVVGEYTWSADNTTCSVNGKCQTCDATTVVQATMSDKVTVTATCKTEGLVTRSATFTESWAENQSKEVNVGKNPANHELKTYVYDINGETHTKKNACCQTVVAENVTHNYDNAEFKCECGDVKKFTVTWIVDGVEKYSELLEYNSDIPEKEIPAKEGYTGKWDTTGKVKGETTITAKWTINNHQVKWMNGDTSIETTNYDYGEAIVVPNDPVKSPNGCITYEFAGWEGYTEGMTMPDSNVTFIAQFKEVVKHKEDYTYTDNGDGTHTGKYACCGADETTEAHSYKEGVCVCEHVQIITIRFLDEDGNELRAVEVTYGNVPVYGEDVPAKSAEAEEKCVAYEFVGWSTVRNGDVLTTLSEAKEDTVYYAVFKAVTAHTNNATWSHDENHHWRICSECKTIITDTKNSHNFVDGSCSQCGFQQIAGLFRLYGTNLKAGDCLDLFFYVKKSDVDGKSGVHAKITRYYNDHKTAPQERTIVFDDWKNYNSTLYRFCYDDIAAKEMMDQVSVVIYANDENGTPIQVSETFYESVENYAIRSLNAYKDNSEGTRQYAMCVALADMLNYGAAAQQYFGYDPSNLANTRLEGNEDYKAFATVDTPDCSNSTVNTSGNLLGDSVTASTNMEYNFYFSNITKDMTAYITYTDHYGNSKTQTVNGMDFYGGKIINDVPALGVPVKGLAVADGRQLITCVVKDSEGNTRAEATSSIESYVFRQLQTEKAHLFAPLIKFVDSAKTFFDMSN